MEQAQHPDFVLAVKFYQTEGGAEPVRLWLRSLPQDQRKAVGEDIKTVQFGWPIGMPVVRKLEPSLWEVRTRFRDGIARVLFTVREDQMVLLHGFIKKSQQTPLNELQTARHRHRKNNI